MARAVAEYFVDSGADITHVVASPLLRAQMSAAPTTHLRARSNMIHNLIVASRFEECGGQLPWVLARPEYWRYYVNPLRPSWGESLCMLPNA